MLTFHKGYFVLTIIIFIIEVIIALYVKDDFIRPYVGDVLVVILIYTFVKTFIKAPVLPVAIGVLIFSFVVEFLQLIKIVGLLGLGHLKWARIIIGTSFSWLDIVTYVVGFILVLIGEKYIFKHNLKSA
ncbi:DUF2809 domain-containing protein [Flavobacteriaceae bacterium Ap0902]|nr:DUF2809 domain-containing protein [Flavobacteriaceae bacterium Ap0902]